MSGAYAWRRLTASQRGVLMQHRRVHGQPWHSPPHWKANFGHRFFLLSAACFEHQPRIGQTLERMDAFAEAWLELLDKHCEQVLAWCVLPNHYHALVETIDLSGLLSATGIFHGRTSFIWNTEENKRGRTNFYRCFERAMRSEAHQWVTINYIHHNPVHHGYVSHWTEWPWHSAHAWIEHHGRTEVERLWRQYPVFGLRKRLGCAGALKSF